MATKSTKVTKMVSRIQFIINKGLTATDSDKRKEERYRRAVENAIANTQDAIDEHTANADEILKKSGEFAVAGKGADLGKSLNAWLDEQDTIASLTSSLTNLKSLLASLDDEVEVTEE